MSIFTWLCQKYGAAQIVKALVNLRNNRHSFLLVLSYSHKLGYIYIHPIFTPSPHCLVKKFLLLVEFPRFLRLEFNLFAGATTCVTHGYVYCIFINQEGRAATISRPLSCKSRCLSLVNHLSHLIWDQMFIIFWPIPTSCVSAPCEPTHQILDQISLDSGNGFG